VVCVRAAQRFADYDPFAWLYSKYWGEEFHQEAVPVLDRLILCRLPRRAEVLDLCCGDGRITQTLAKRGYRVTGLDGSERMLTFAKQRAPKVEFLLADARRFKLPRRFDAAISTFDSLNHVMNTADLKKVFRNVAACLKPGGLFAFDLNREEAYAGLWSRTTTIVDKTAVSVARGRYDRARKTAVCHVALVRLDGDRWERSDFQLRQKFHARGVVLRALTEAGFAPQVFDAARDLAMQGDIGSERDFYLGKLTEPRP
jgi:SAM-dependent methyltransferase